MISPSVLRRKLPPVVGWAASFLCYGFLIAAALARHAFDGFIGDGAAYVAVNTFEYSTHPFLPYLSLQDTGHPLIFAWVNGLFWRWLGIRPAIANISIWLYAALALTALHHLSRRAAERALGARAPRWAGPAAALCLFSTPLFISNTAQYLSEIPNLAFTLMMLAAWDSDRRGWLVFWALLTAFTRITGCLEVFGLGVYDLWRRSRRERSLGGLLRWMAPWLFCGALFVLYLAIKLWVLGRPMTMIAQNGVFLLDPAALARQIGLVLNHTLNEPSYSFALLMIPIVLTLVRDGGRADAEPEAGVAAPSADAGGNAALYVGFLALLAGPTLLYAVQDLWPQPRWFLVHHALIILAGVQALLFLLPRRPRTLVLLLALWCALQVVRWQPSWTARVLRRVPALERQLAMYPPLTLEALEYKRLNQKLAEWYFSQTDAQPLFIAGYAALKTLEGPTAGYIRDANKVASVKWLAASEERLDDFLQIALAEKRVVYLLQASWDSADEQAAMFTILDTHPAFVTAAKIVGKPGDEIRVYRCRPEMEVDLDSSRRIVRRNFSARLYQILLGRMVDLAALDSWDDLMSHAKDRRQAAIKGIRGLVDSPEFNRRWPTPRDQTEQLYQALLNRSPTQQEAKDWSDALAAGEKTLDDLIAALAQSDAFDAMLEHYFPPSMLPNAAPAVAPNAAAANGS